MRKAVKRLGAFDPDKDCLNVVVETPKGSRVKYAYNLETDFFELKRALPEGMMFPFNFGFIPGTKAEDGDPLDILILNQEPLFPGCLLKARLIGVIKAEQTEDGETTRNDRLIGMAIGKLTPSSLKGAAREMETFSQVEHFFISYNQLSGKKFKVIGRRGRGEALALVRKSQTKNEPS